MSGHHHPLGPSRLDRYAKCPGSYAATERIKAQMTPEDFEAHTTNEAAQEGTMLHEVMAGMQPPAALTEEQQDLIARSEEYKDMHFGDCDTVLLEQHLTLTDGFDVLTEGTADVVGLTDGIVKILDWKYGRMWVNPDSLQGKAYAAAAMQCYERDTCEFHIFQPRAGDGKPILYSSFDEIFGEVKAVIEQAKSPYALLQAGEHCGYCPARLDCTAAANLETGVAAPIDTLLANPARLGQAAEVATVVKKRCDQILAACKAATIKGEATGHKIIERAGKPSIVDALKARDRVLPILTNEEVLSIVTIPYGQLRDAVAAKQKEADGTSAKESEERLIETLGDAFVRGNPAQVCVVDKSGRGK